jgi:hypothetical protein
MDGSTNRYAIKYEGAECCKAMQEMQQSGVFLFHLTLAARNISGEYLPEFRFCPWCGWDNDRGSLGITTHRKKLEMAEDADRIGAVL